jgi:hypothetical protein
MFEPTSGLVQKNGTGTGRNLDRTSNQSTTVHYQEWISTVYFFWMGVSAYPPRAAVCPHSTWTMDLDLLPKYPLLIKVHLIILAVIRAQKWRQKAK